LALAVGCATRPAATPSTELQPVDRAWRQGPRDSLLATAMACELLRMFDQIGGGCVVVGYRETPAEYVLRLRQHDRTRSAPANQARLEVRLTKDGDSATVKQLPVP
jgi:hypothetical protein